METKFQMVERNSKHVVAVLNLLRNNPAVSTNRIKLILNHLFSLIKDKLPLTPQATFASIAVDFGMNQLVISYYVDTFSSKSLAGFFLAFITTVTNNLNLDEYQISPADLETIYQGQQ